MPFLFSEFSGGKMDLKDVINAVETVEDNKFDPEEAHILEDELHARVLEYIASGKCSDPVKFSSEALKTEKINFARWYA